MSSDEIDQIVRESEAVRVFEQTIPEIGDGRIEIKAVARQAPWRTKIALFSRDPRIDCIRTCVGINGCVIWEIIDQWEGERIDLVRWDHSLEAFIANALQPVEVRQVVVNDARDRAIVNVDLDQLDLARGYRGLNRKLASRLCGCEIEFASAAESPWTMEL